MWPLQITAQMSESGRPAQIQGDLVELLKGLCGAPSRERNINVGTMLGRISISWQNFLSGDIPEIKRRLLAYEGINPETLDILEMREIHH